MKTLSLPRSTCLGRSICSLVEGRPPPGCSRGAESCTCAQRAQQLIGKVLNHAVAGEQTGQGFMCTENREGLVYMKPSGFVHYCN
jgi:hypothetical protein